MSADNWAICPQCYDRAKADVDARLREAAAAYGAVPADEYEQLITAARLPIDPETFRTFREDYEFYGASDGKVVASYSGGCTVCNLSVSFTHERVFYEGPA